MAQNEAEEKDIITCDICFEIFKEPKTLTCLHRFCEKCLESYVNGMKTSLLLRQGGFPCPVCREKIQAPDPKKPPSQWVSMLKTDFFLNKVIRYVETKGSITVVSKKPTHPCDKHRDNECDLFCVDCQQIICHLCAGISHRSCSKVETVVDAAVSKKSAFQHFLKKLDNATTQTASVDHIREKCTDNLEKQKKKVEGDIKSWSEKFQSDIRQEETRLLQDLEKSYKSLCEKITLKCSHHEEIMKTLRERIGDIPGRSASLSGFDVLKISDSMQSNTIKEAEENISLYKAFIDQLKGIEILFDPGPKPEANLGSVNMRNKREKDTPFLSSNTLEVSSDEAKVRKYDLDIGNSILYTKDSTSKTRSASQSASDGATSRFKGALSKILPHNLSHRQPHREDRVNPGIVKYSNEKVYYKPPIAAPTKISQVSQSIDRGKICESKMLRKVTTSFRDEHATPKLRDIIVTFPGNTIIVTDWANDCVKAFFVRSDKNCFLAVGGKPWAITQLNESIAAVSLPLARRICVLKIGSPLIVQKSFVVSKNYSGLASFNSYTLVASGGNDPPTVDIINLFGEVLKSFSLDQHSNPLFVYPAYVSVTPSMQILVSDKKRCAVIALSHSGDVQFQFNPQGNKQLQEPCGIATSSSGAILLLETRGLLKLTPRGELDRPLLRHQDGHVANPKGIAVGADGLIYVTTNEDEVAVFSFS